MTDSTVTVFNNEGDVATPCLSETPVPFGPFASSHTGAVELMNRLLHPVHVIVIHPWVNLFIQPPKWLIKTSSHDGTCIGSNH